MNRSRGQREMILLRDAGVLVMAGLMTFAMVGWSLADEPPTMGSESPAQEMKSETVQEGNVESRALPQFQRPKQGPATVLKNPGPVPFPLSPPPTWDQVWDHTWREIAATGPIQIAPTVAAQPVCQGNLGIDMLIRNAIQAMALRKYGDAANFLGQYQDRTLCLTPSGVRQLDLALTLYVMTALKALPPFTRPPG